MNIFVKTLVTFASLSLLVAAPPQLPAVYAAPAANQQQPVGQVVRFRAKTISGKQISSDQLAGRPYIVNFFASWCPPCRKELPEMVELQKKYENTGFTFIGIVFRDNASMYPDFLWELGIDYPVMMSDPALEAEFARHLPGGVRSIPITFVVGRDGRVIKVLKGGQGRDVFEGLILQALQQR